MTTLRQHRSGSTPRKEAFGLAAATLTAAIVSTGPWAWTNAIAPAVGVLRSVVGV